MKFCKSSNHVFLLSVLALMVLLLMGCSQRSSRGVLHHGSQVSKGANGIQHAQSIPDESLKSKDISAMKGEGYFPSENVNMPDLLEEETEVIEDPTLDQDLQSLLSANDYWLNRTRAEQVTARSELQDVHFDFNSAQLNDQAKLILVADAEWIKTHPQADVTIEGHCDDRGTSAYNFVLGEKRAVRTKNYLASLGVKADRLHIISFGKDNPACIDPTEPCYKKNRRAHLVLGVNMAATAMR